MGHRSFRYRLYPTPDQEQKLREFIGVCRLVYNLAWEQRRDHWRNYLAREGKHISFAGQCRELTALRAEFDWIAAVPAVSQIYALRDLDAAFRRYFSGGSAYPSPRRKSDSATIRFKARDIVAPRALNGRWADFRVPGIGRVRFRQTRAIQGRPLNISISLQAGQWFVSFACSVEHDARDAPPASVGIDRGVARTLTLSTGEHMQAPHMAPLNEQIARARTVLARRKRGSGRYAAQRAKLSRLTAKAARVRTDWAHRASTDIARRFGLVAVEALNIKAMTASAAGTIEAPGRNVAQKRGLNRSILEQSWGRFSGFLDYKLAERGGVLVTVPAAFTSQTCGACGVVDAKSRESQARFRCVHCGHEDNADRNAAVEILRRSTALLDVEAGVARPAKRQSAEVRHVH